MRCIEIPQWRIDVGWDNPININMRCIEMLGKYYFDSRLYSININMRCIEIRMF